MREQRIVIVVGHMGIGHIIFTVGLGLLFSRGLGFWFKRCLCQLLGCRFGAGRLLRSRLGFGLLSSSAVSRAYAAW